MKKTLSMLAIMSAVLVSCTKSEINEDNGNPQDEPVYEISISSKDLTFGAEGGDQSVTVTSSEDWYLDGESDWCKVSTSYGSNGDKVTFSADPYENTNEERTATFTFYCGDKDVELVVTQEAKVYSISVEPKELTFEVEGGEKEITITSSDNWNLSYVPEWITLSEDGGENGAIITVTVEYNDETDTRSGDILFICGDKDTKVSVTQQADDSPIIQFKDPYFLNALLRTYTVTWNNKEYKVDVDKNNDRQISETEAAAVRVLGLSNLSDKIRNLDEISYFTSLEYLSCYGNELTTLDVSNNPALTELVCGGNELTTLDVSNNPALTYLSCYGNELTTLDVSNNTALTYLSCGGNELTTLDVSNNPALTELSCDGNELTTLDVSNNTALTYLSCGGNELTTLDVSNNPALTELSCYGNELTTLDVSNSTVLTELKCGGNQFISLDLGGCASLTHLDCIGNKRLASIDVSECHILDEFDCVSYYIRFDEFGKARFNGIVPGSELPLESLKIYKYHIINSENMKAINEAYKSVIEYVE